MTVDTYKHSSKQQTMGTLKHSCKLNCVSVHLSCTYHWDKGARLNQMLIRHDSLWVLPAQTTLFWRGVSITGVQVRDIHRYNDTTYSYNNILT